MMAIHPALQARLDEAKAATDKMIADTIASGQVKMLSAHCYATREEAVTALKPFSTFAVGRNIAGRWVHY